MKVPYVLVVVAVIVIVVGFRWLVGRFLTLEGRTLGAVSALEKASKRYDHAAIALSAVLGLHLQPEDPISQTLLPACSRWDATVGAQLSAGDQLQVSMNQARSEFTAAELALQQANDLVLTLTGPDPYGRLGAQDDPAGAAPIVQLATDSGAPYAMGRLLAGQSDFAGAAAAYQGAIDSGDADVAPRAAVNMRMLCQGQGDFASAAAAYQVAIDSGHADLGPNAAVNLGSLRGEHGDPIGAVEAYKLAIDSGHADEAPKATLLLGLLRAMQGDSAGAVVALQMAVHSGHADVAPRAAVNLGMLCEEKGDFASAAAAYQVAIVSGHADAAALARRQLEHLERTITTSETADGEGSRR